MHHDFLQFAQAEQHERGVQAVDLPGAAVERGARDGEHLAGEHRVLFEQSLDGAELDVGVLREREELGRDDRQTRWLVVRGLEGLDEPFGQLAGAEQPELVEIELDLAHAVVRVLSRPSQSLGHE